MLIIIQGINYVQNRKQNKWINWLSWWYWRLDKCRPACYPRYSLLVQPFFFFLFLFPFSCFLAPSWLFFFSFLFPLMLWCSSLSCSIKLLFGPFLLKCSQMTANFVKIVFKKIGYSLLDKKVKMQFLRLKKKKEIRTPFKEALSFVLFREITRA